VKAKEHSASRSATWQYAGAAAASVAIAVALYSRFSISSTMSRDEGIYAYGAQQLAHGVPPYASIFDPKGPLATILGGLAAVAARMFGRNDIYAIRAGFFVLACLTVLAMFLLVARLFDSVLGGLTAAVVFAANWPFAVDAIGGPNAKTPAVLFSVVSMWLLARRQWFWGGFAAALSVLVWQPMIGYAVVAVLLPFAVEPGRRLRSAGMAIAGGAVPTVLTAGYFAVAGAFHEFLESAVVFPVSAVERTPETVVHRLGRIVDVINAHYGFGGVLFWVGIGLLVVLAVVSVWQHRSTPYDALTSPLVAVVLLTLLLTALYAATDFQSYPDLYPFLPYPAIGIGGAAALLLAATRKGIGATVPAVAVLVALAVLTVASWISFSNDPFDNDGLRRQLTSACGIDRLARGNDTLLSLGDPVPLVTTHRRNPDRYIYLGSGVDQWKIDHTRGGLAGWQAQIRRWDPSVVVLHGWGGRYRRPMVQFLKQNGYASRYVGLWRVFVSPEVLSTAGKRGVKLAKHPRKFAHGPGGRRLPARDCA
jgi:hypothetical protein